MQSEVEKNKSAALGRWSKMKDWTMFRDRVEKLFLHEAEKAKESGYFCNLYVSKEIDHRQIQLFTGQTPTGESVPVRNDLGVKTSTKLVSEGGGALVLSQSTLGEVAIILYPLKSEKLSRIKDKIIWTVKPSPSAISSRMLEAAIRDFYIYLRVSSSRLNESALDRARIAYLEFRSSQYEGAGALVKVIYSKWLLPLIMLSAAIVGIWSGVKFIAN